MAKNIEGKKKILNYCRLYVLMKSPNPVSVTELYELMGDRRLGVSNVLTSKKQLSSLLTKKWDSNGYFKKSYGRGGAIYWRCG